MASHRIESIIAKGLLATLSTDDQAQAQQQILRIKSIFKEMSKEVGLAVFLNLSADFTHELEKEKENERVHS